MQASESETGKVKGMKNTENNSASRLLAAAKMDYQQLAQQFLLSENGLNDDDVAKSLNQYGSNEIAKKKKENVIKKRYFSMISC